MTKPGTCPRFPIPSPLVKCMKPVDKCHNDGDCLGNLKCCRVHFCGGLVCVRPVKPGTCSQQIIYITINHQVVHTRSITLWRNCLLSEYQYMPCSYLSAIAAFHIHYPTSIRNWSNILLRDPGIICSDSIPFHFDIFCVVMVISRNS